MTLRNANLIQVHRRVADDFMKRNEVLGNVGLGVYHFGLVANDNLIGVISFGTCCFSARRGFLARLLANAGGQLTQLCRGGCSADAPPNAGSRQLSLALNAIYRLRGPGIIVAYSDDRIGEIGTIYQAANGIYTGLTAPKGQANYIIDGRRMSAWQVRKRFGTRRRSTLASLVQSLEVLPLHPKHRYLFVVGSPGYKRRVRRDLSHIVKPYPKRGDLGVSSLHLYSSTTRASVVTPTQDLVNTSELAEAS